MAVGRDVRTLPEGWDEPIPEAIWPDAMLSAVRLDPGALASTRVIQTIRRWQAAAREEGWEAREAQRLLRELGAAIQEPNKPEARLDEAAANTEGPLAVEPDDFTQDAFQLPPKPRLRRPQARQPSETLPPVRSAPPLPDGGPRAPSVLSADDAIVRAEESDTDARVKTGASLPPGFGEEDEPPTTAFLRSAVEELPLRPPLPAPSEAPAARRERSERSRVGQEEARKERSERSWVGLDSAGPRPADWVRPLEPEDRSERSRVGPAPLAPGPADLSLAPPRRVKPAEDPNRPEARSRVGLASAGPGFEDPGKPEARRDWSDRRWVGPASAGPGAADPAATLALDLTLAPPRPGWPASLEPDPEDVVRASGRSGPFSETSDLEPLSSRAGLAPAAEVGAPSAALEAAPSRSAGRSPAVGRDPASPASPGSLEFEDDERPTRYIALPEELRRPEPEPLNGDPEADAEVPEGPGRLPPKPGVIRRSSRTQRPQSLPRPRAAVHHVRAMYGTMKGLAGELLPLPYERRSRRFWARWREVAGDRGVRRDFIEELLRTANDPRMLICELIAEVQSVDPQSVYALVDRLNAEADAEAPKAEPFEAQDRPREALLGASVRMDGEDG